jgi:PAS domain-containing protein
VRDSPLEIRHRAGHITPVLYNVSLYRNAEGQVIGVFAAARGVTELWRAEMKLDNCRRYLEELVRERTHELDAANSKLQAEIMERKQVEEALRESKTLIRAVTEGTSDPVHVKDTQSQIMLCNPALLRIYGKPLEYVIGKTDKELYADPVVGETIVANDLMVLESGRSHAIEEVAQALA